METKELLSSQQHPQQPTQVPRRRFALSRKLCILLSLLITLVIIALAVGLGVGLSRRNKSNGAGSSNSNSGSSSGNITVSSVPSDSTQVAMGVVPSSNGLWQPPVNASWQIVLNSALKIDYSSTTITPNVDVFDIDLEAHEPKAIAHLHALGKRVICYFSAGSAEDWRLDWKRFVKHADYESGVKGWDGEYWVRTDSPNVRAIMRDRIKSAYEKGCDAIDPDNVDGYNNENGAGLTKAMAVDYINFLSDEAAKYNMSMGLKNAMEIIPSVLDKVHFAVNEQCMDFNECDKYDPVIKAGKPVFHIEYPKGDDADDHDAVTTDTQNKKCATPRILDGYNPDFSTNIKNMNLDGWVQYCDGVTAVTPCNTTAPARHGGSSDSPSSYGSS